MTASMPTQEKKLTTNYQYRPAPLAVRMDARDSEYPLHWHEHLEITLVTEGGTSFFCDSAPVPATPGDVLIYNCNQLHHGKGGTVRYHCLIIDLSVLESRALGDSEQELIRAVASNQKAFQNRISRDHYLNGLIYQIVDEFSKKRDGWELAVKSSLFAIFVHLCRNYVCEKASGSENQARLKNLIRFNKMMEYIAANYQNPISLEELAGTVSMSKYHFCRLFKKITGTNVSAFLLDYRLSKAAKLLESGGLNVSETAYQCGFTDVNYFSRQFKKLKGYPPSRVIRRRSE